MAEEQALVRRCVAGEPAACSTLFRQHQPRVRRVLARFGATEDELDDLVQETFVSIFKGLPRFKGRSRLSTWIYRVTAHTALAYKRQVGRQREREDAYAETVRIHPHP